MFFLQSDREVQQNTYEITDSLKVDMQIMSVRLTNIESAVSEINKILNNIKSMQSNPPKQRRKRRTAQEIAAAKAEGASNA